MDGAEQKGGKVEGREGGRKKMCDQTNERGDLHVCKSCT